MTKVRTVVDTNVIVPAIFSNTPVYRYIESGNIIPLWNNFIKNEILEKIEKLGSLYIRKKNYTKNHIKLAKQLCNEILAIEFYVSEMPDNWPSQSKDRNDDPILWVALNGNAEFVITQDKKHLLSLKKFNNIPIGTPHDFFQWAKINRPIR